MTAPLPPAGGDRCGCCDAAPPARVRWNAPGLAALDYRLDTHAGFLARMRARIHGWTVPDGDGRGSRPLRPLGTRSTEDPAVALMDAAAVMLDVLSFYQERIANEGFLRTATERRSVLELARAIGYELRPGVAAHAFVAFTVDEAEGAPRTAHVPAGTRVASVPARQDELPQTFETTDPIVARRAWNRLRPRQSHPQVVSAAATHLWLRGASSRLSAGDVLVVVAGAEPAVRTVRRVLVDAAAGRTRVDFADAVVPPAEPAPAWPAGAIDAVIEPIALTRAAVDAHVVRRAWPAADLQAFVQLHRWDADEMMAHVHALRAAADSHGDGEVHALRRRAAVFGHAAPEWRIMSRDMRADYLELDDPDELPGVDPGEWPAFEIFAPEGTRHPLPALVRSVAVTRETLAAAVGAATRAATSRTTGSATSEGVRTVFQAARIAATAVDMTARAADALQHVADRAMETVGRAAAGIIEAQGTLVADLAPPDLPNVAEAMKPSVDALKELAEELGSLEVDLENLAALPEKLGRIGERMAGMASDTMDSLGVIVEEVNAMHAAFHSRASTALQGIAGGMEPIVGGLTEGVFQVAEGVTPLQVLEDLQASTVALAESAGEAMKAVTAALAASAAAAAVELATQGALADPDGGVQSLRQAVLEAAELAVGAAPDVVTVGALGATAPGGLLGAAGYLLSGEFVDAQRVAAEEGAGRVRDDVAAAMDALLAVAPPPPPAPAPPPARRIDLDASYPKVQAGGWAVLEAGGTARPFRVAAAEGAARAEYALSARTTRVTLDGGDLASFATRVRDTTVLVESEPLPLAASPAVADLPAGLEELWLDTMAFGLEPGRHVALSGREPGDDGVAHVEILVLDEVLHAGGRTRLRFDEGTRYAYRRDTVAVNANVVGATHGETVAREVLGGGDASVAHQRFTLRRPPLTHVSAATPRGARGTLVVRVDGVRWEEVESLHGRGPDERVYVVRIDDDANATVVFGDGRAGARLPTGQENVVAAYRTGIGSAGEVGTDALTLMPSRPFGVRAVTNPLPAAGAGDPERLDDARRNAPLTVLTLDRIVSLQDHEDFARAFAGIGCARAAAVWNGEAGVVHVTVTDAGGDPVTEPLLSNLRDAMRRARDPRQPLVLASHQPLLFTLSARLLVDPAREWDAVRTAVARALEDRFGFARRDLAQPVSAAEVVRAMHEVPGVVAVDLDALLRTAPGPGAPPAGGPLGAVLDARPARWSAAHGRILPAELLLVHPAGITLSRMTPDPTGGGAS